MLHRWDRSERERRSLQRWRRRERLRRWWDARRDRFGFAAVLGGVALLFLTYPGDYDGTFRVVMASVFLLFALVVATEWKPLERAFVGLNLVAWALWGLLALAGLVVLLVSWIS
jgi:hypothetical protein